VRAHNDNDRRTYDYDDCWGDNDNDNDCRTFYDNDLRGLSGVCAGIVYLSMERASVVVQIERLWSR
jgi:hypothetical protein